MAGESENKVKFWFNYKLLHPNDDDVYSFEEIRARTYDREYELKKQLEEKYKEKLVLLEEKLKEKEDIINNLKRSSTAVATEMATNTTICQEKTTNRTTKSVSFQKNHGSCTTMFGNDYTTTVDNFTNVTQFDHITANVSVFRDMNKIEDESEIYEGSRSKIQKRSNFSAVQDDSALASRSLCPPPPPPMGLDSIYEPDGMTAKLERIRKAEKTMFCDVPESIDTPTSAKYNKTVTVNTLHARKQIDHLLGNLGEESLCSAENTERLPPPPCQDSIRIYNDSVPASQKSQAEFSVFKDENLMEADKGAGKKMLANRKPLQVLATNPTDFLGGNESSELLENESLLGDKIEFAPPSMSTRNLKPILNHIRENGGLKASKFFSPNERTLQPIIDDSLELNSSAIEPPPVEPIFKTPIAPKWPPEKGHESEIVQPDRSAIKLTPDQLAQDESLKIPELAESGLTEPTTRATASLTYDYNYLDIQNSVKRYDNIPEIAINDQVSELVVPSQKSPQPEAEAVSDEKPTSKLLTSEKFEQSFKLYYQICYEPSMNESNKSTIKTNLEQLQNMSIYMNKLVEEEDQRSPEQLKPDNMTQGELNKLRITFNHTDIQNPMTNSESMLADETFSGGMNSSYTKTVPLNDTIVKSVQNPFSFDIKNRLLNRAAVDYLKKKPNYASVMVKGPEVKEKRNVMVKDSSYRVISEIGKGAYAKIFLIEPQIQAKDKRRALALKADANSTAWEFYITETIHDRLQKLKQEGKMRIDVTSSFVRMEQFIKYNDGCLSTMEYYKNGSLLDLINYHLKKNENFPYWFVIYLTLELLNIIDYLHKCRIIHADIKPDNLLINKLPDRLEYFDPSRSKCLVLIDFNRSIDLNLLPEEAEFDAKTDNKSLLCCEMKADKPWTYQIDYFGVLSSMHCIIFKKYMNTYRCKDTGRNKITNSVPRTFDKLFADFFDTYLNIPSCNDMPVLDKEWIKKFEALFKNELLNFHKYDKYLKALISTDLHKL